MDDNTSIQFRLRLAQINGINMNEEQLSETNHQRIDESLDHITRITQALKDPNPDVRRNAITHHLATPEHLEQGMKDPDGSVRTVASIIHKRDHDPITDAARPQHLGDED